MVCLRSIGVLAGVLSLVACSAVTRDAPSWQDTLAARLSVFGHRNWIVVADAAYPAQSRAGVETLYAGGDHLAAVARVLAAVDGAAHVRAVVHLDAELEAVSEAAAPGVSAYRAGLAALLAGRPVEREPHGDLIATLDRAGETFSVLVIKTDLTLPYTTVFLELDCGYWSAEQEQQMRAALGASAP